MDPNLVFVDQYPGDPATQMRALERERAHLVAALTTHPAVTSAVLATDEDTEMAVCTNVVYLTTKHGQMSWHIADDDLDLFTHLPRVTGADVRAAWDGHSTAEKYARLRDLLATTPEETHQP